MKKRNDYEKDIFIKVKNSTNYEIEASGVVTLEDGFKVERGATFAVYPACF